MSILCSLVLFALAHQKAPAPTAATISLNRVKSVTFVSSAAVERSGKGSALCLVESPWQSKRTKVTTLDLKTGESTTKDLEENQDCLGTDKNGMPLFVARPMEKQSYADDIYDIRNGICLQKYWVACIFSWAMNDPDRMTSTDPRFSKPWEMSVPLNIWQWDSYGPNPDIVAIGTREGKKRFQGVDYTHLPTQKTEPKLEIFAFNSVSVETPKLPGALLGGKNVEFWYVYDLVLLDRNTCLVAGLTRPRGTKQSDPPKMPAQATRIDMCKIDIRKGEILKRTSVKVPEISRNPYIHRVSFTQDARYALVKMSETSADIFSISNL